MLKPDLDQVSLFLTAKIIEKKSSIDAPLDPTENLIEAGLFDSLDFISLISEIEAKFNLDLDFSELDPTEFTTYQGLIHHLTNQTL